MMRNTIILLCCLFCITSCKTYLLRGKVVYSNNQSSLVNVLGSHRHVWVNETYSNGTVIEIKTKSISKIKPTSFIALCSGDDVHCHYGGDAHKKTHIRPIGGGKVQKLMISGEEHTLVEVREEDENEYFTAWLPSSYFSVFEFPIEGYVIYSISENNAYRTKLENAFIIIDFMENEHH